MPRQLIATAPRTPEFQDYEAPEVGPKDVLVRSLFGAFKHGTELISYRGEDPQRDSNYDPEWQMFVPAENAVRFPRGLGNMIVGEVIEVGAEVETVAVGDRVTAHSSMKDLVAWPESQVRALPPGMSWQAATCLDPLCFAFSAVRDGQIRLGDNVAIFGMGAIGLFAVQCALMQGAERVFVVDPIERRRKLAIAWGAEAAFDPTASDAGAEIRKLTDKKGADVCIETSGNYNAMHHAIRGVAFGGNVVAVAYPKPCIGGLDLGREAHFNLPNLIFARACSEPTRDHPRWSFQRIEDTCWRMLADGKFKTDEALDPVVPFDQAADAWRQVDESPQDSVKLGVAF